ncbi:MAG: hypothetical protein H7X76_00045 [Prolixibacteraceae bacterium]|nr:hypothetical protein [Burkholderiales bacterium]
MKSRQGEPFLAVANLASLPEENISSACLSMGPESDAPGSEMPFLAKANLKLDAARNLVTITTDEPVAIPALALVLRVQCAGAPLYARHFSALIPPAVSTTQSRLPDAPSATRRGFRLSLLRGDTVESVAAVIFPGQRGLQRNLVRQVIAGNPNAFPNGRARELPAGTVLWFPDLRDIRKSVQVGPLASATTGARRAGRSVVPSLVQPAPPEVAEAMPPKPRKPVTLRRALELGDKPGPQECRQLMELCGAETPSAVAPELEDKARKLESGVNALHLKQDSIDQQLQRLEQSLQALQSAIRSAPAVAAQPAPPPAKVVVRTVVKSEPISWIIWAALAGLVVAAAIGGFAFGRRGSLSRGLAETDEQLDRMLATAATVMRELESTPAPTPAPRSSLPKPPPAPRKPPARPVPVELADASPPAAGTGQGADFTLDTSAMLPAAAVDVELKSDSPAQHDPDGLSTDVLFEMDQALDNTRSMFTDVDRFIALGRTENALSLLQFQVHKDPKDRDSWIKLMAIYRQQKMDLDLSKAVRQFKNNFPNEKPPVV